MNSPQPVYRFGDFILDTANLRLTQAGEVRPLEPKSFRLLQYLVEHRGRIVPKEEIFASLWPDAAVTDNALTRVVTQVRKALSDDPKQPRFIETVPTVGYRFIGTLSSGSANELAAAEAEGRPPLPSPEKPTPTRSGRPLRWVAALVVLSGLALLTIAAFRTRWQPKPPAALGEGVQYTNGSGLDVCPNFASAGSLFAFASDRSGSFQIYVRSLAPGSPGGRRHLRPRPIHVPQPFPRRQPSRV